MMDENYITCIEDVRNAVKNIWNKYKKVGDPACGLEMENLLEMSIVLQDYDAMILTLKRTLNIMKDLGLYACCFNLLIKNFKVFNEIDDKKTRSQFERMKGNLFYSLGNYELALLNYEKAEKNLLSQDVYEEFCIYHNIAIVKLKMNKMSDIDKDIKREEVYFNKVRENKSLDTIAEIEGDYLNIKALYAYKIGALDKAEELYKETINFANKNNDWEEVIANYLELAEISILRKNYFEAEEILRKTEKICFQKHRLSELSKIYNILSKIYEERKNYEKAYKMLRIKEKWELNIKENIETVFSEVEI